MLEVGKLEVGKLEVGGMEVGEPEKKVLPFLFSLTYVIFPMSP